MSTDQPSQHDASTTMIKNPYIFDDNNYPRLNEVPSNTEAGALAFSVRHIQDHLTRSLGTMATQHEAFDHGKEMDLQALAPIPKKLLINAIKLAEVLDQPIEEMIAEVLRELKY